ncbi:MAG: hypothetical protein ABWY55_10935 [Microbacterium sp.]
MFQTTTRNRVASAAIALALVAGAGSLTACQSPGARGSIVEQDRPGPAIGYERSTPLSAEYSGLSADRIEAAIQDKADESRALAERFAGVPADRIEEQLAREQGD